jgi:cytochrome c-type biogenesis protein
MESVGIAAAFAGGLVSFLSPCVLPLVPPYIAMMTGFSVAELEHGVAPRWRAAASSLMFVVGFSAVFIAMQLTVSAVSRAMVSNQVLLRRVGGGVVLAMSLLLAAEATGKLRILSRDYRFDISRLRKRNGGGSEPGAETGRSPSLRDEPGACCYPTESEASDTDRSGTDRTFYLAPLMGAAFAFGWTPCIGPILGAVLAVAGSDRSISRGLLLLLAYCGGLGVPFVLVSVAMGRATGLLKRLRRHSAKLIAASSAALAAFGLLLLFNKTALIAIWLQQVFRQVGLSRLAGI